MIRVPLPKSIRAWNLAVRRHLVLYVKDKNSYNLSDYMNITSIDSVGRAKYFSCVNLSKN